MPHARTHSTHTRALVAAVAVLAVFTFLPARYGYWLGRVQSVPALALGPSQWLFRSAAGLFVRPRRDADESQLHALEMDRDQWKSQYYAERERRRAVEQRLAQFETGALEPEPGVRTRRARVIGVAGAPGTQMLRLRAGASDGVTRGVVAVIDRVQVAGRVESVRAGECTLVLITQKGQSIQGALITDDRPDAPADAVTLCQLKPFGDGTLRGLVEYKPAAGTAPAPGAKVGQTVYLSDPSWAPGSSMLVVGRVTEVQNPLEDPLRPVIVVEPTVKLDMLAEVTLRIPDTQAAGGGG